MDGSLFFSLSFSWKIIMFQQLFLWKFLPVNLINQSPQTWNLNPPVQKPASRFPGHLAIVGTWWVKPGGRNSGFIAKAQEMYETLYMKSMTYIYHIQIPNEMKESQMHNHLPWSSTFWHQTCHVWRLRRLEASRVGRHHRITPSSHGDGDVPYVETTTAVFEDQEFNPKFRNVETLRFFNHPSILLSVNSIQKMFVIPSFEESNTWNFLVQNTLPPLAGRTLWMGKSMAWRASVAGGDW